MGINKKCAPPSGAYFYMMPLGDLVSKWWAGDKLKNTKVRPWCFFLFIVGDFLNRLRSLSYP